MLSSFEFNRDWSFKISWSSSSLMMTMSIALSKSFRCSGSTHSRRFFSSTANRSVKHWNRCSVSRMDQPYTVTLIGLLFHRFLPLLLGMVSPGSIVAFWIVALIISSATLHSPPSKLVAREAFRSPLGNSSRQMKTRLLEEWQTNAAGADTTCCFEISNLL